MHVDIVKELLEAGADIKQIPDIILYVLRSSIKNEILEGAWIWNPSSRTYRVLKLLLEHGADPNVSDIDGNTTLHLAIRNEEIADLLLRYGANKYKKNKQGYTPEDYKKPVHPMI